MRRSTEGLGQICFDVNLEMLPNLNFRKHSLVLLRQKICTNMPVLKKDGIKGGPTQHNKSSGHWKLRQPTEISLLNFLLQRGS